MKVRFLRARKRDYQKHVFAVVPVAKNGGRHGRKEKKMVYKTENPASRETISPDAPEKKVEIAEEAFCERTAEGKNNTLEKRFRMAFGEEPFPLTAAKLFRLSMLHRHCGELADMGFFYHIRLQEECKLLIPVSLYTFFCREWISVLTAWHANQNFFQCKAIGEVLKIYYALYLEECGYAYQKTDKK